MREFQLPTRLKPSSQLSWSQLGLTTKDDIVLEIGCGVGLHPILFAKQNPQIQLIAIEHTKEKFSKFSQRLQNHKELSQITPLHANAISWVFFEVPKESLSGIYLLYPNPNPKNSSQRWFRMPFFKELVTKIKPEGFVNLACDHKWYAEEAIEHAETLGLTLIAAYRYEIREKLLEVGSLKNLSSDFLMEFRKENFTPRALPDFKSLNLTLPVNLVPPPRTHFEKKYLSRGNPVYDLWFKKE